VGQPGDPYSESLTGMIGIVPAVMYVCRPCGCGTRTSRVGLVRALVALSRSVGPELSWRVCKDKVRRSHR
jgi:hypothetical protein